MTDFRSTRRTVDGFDIEAEVVVLWRLLTKKVLPQYAGLAGAPQVNGTEVIPVRRGRSLRRYTFDVRVAPRIRYVNSESGRARGGIYERNERAASFWHSVPKGKVHANGNYSGIVLKSYATLELVAHELVHAVGVIDHSWTFYRMLKDLLELRFPGLRLDLSQHKGQSGYAVDRLFVKQLEAHLAPKPVEPVAVETVHVSLPVADLSVDRWVAESADALRKAAQTGPVPADSLEDILDDVLAAGGPWLFSTGTAEVQAFADAVIAHPLSAGRSISFDAARELLLGGNATAPRPVSRGR